MNFPGISVGQLSVKAAETSAGTIERLCWTFVHPVPLRVEHLTFSYSHMCPIVPWTYVTMRMVWTLKKSDQYGKTVSRVHKTSLPKQKKKYGEILVMVRTLVL